MVTYAEVANPGNVRIVRQYKCRDIEMVSPFYHKRIFGAVAQLVEQRTENPCVAGSIPARPANQYGNSN